MRGFTLIELILVISIATLTTLLVIPLLKKRHMPAQEQLRFALQDARTTCMIKKRKDCLIEAEDNLLYLPWGKALFIEGLRKGRCYISPAGYTLGCAFVIEEKIVRFSEFEF